MLTSIFSFHMFRVFVENCFKGTRMSRICYAEVNRRFFYYLFSQEIKLKRDP